MSRYLFAVFEDESSYAGMSGAETDEVWRAHDTFVDEVKRAGATVITAEALAPRSTGWFVRGDTPVDPVLIDDPAGPGAPTLGGFYVVDARDDEQAQALAARCPVRGGFVEVRPIVASAAR